MSTEPITWNLSVTAARITNGSASAYRLLRKKDGTLVLQGAFQWCQGHLAGVDWQDIPEVEEE